MAWPVSAVCGVSRAPPPTGSGAHPLPVAPDEGPWGPVQMTSWWTTHHKPCFASALGYTQSDVWRLGIKVVDAPRCGWLDGINPSSREVVLWLSAKKPSRGPPPDRAWWVSDPSQAAVVWPCACDSPSAAGEAWPSYVLPTPQRVPRLPVCRPPRHGSVWHARTR